MSAILEIILLIVCVIVLIIGIITYIRIRFNIIIMLIITILAISGIVTFISLLYKGGNALTSKKYTYEEFVDEYMPEYLDKNVAFIFETVTEKEDGVEIVYDGTITCDSTNLYISYGSLNKKVVISLPRQSIIPNKYRCACDVLVGGINVRSEYYITNDFDENVVLNLGGNDEVNTIVSKLTYKAIYEFLYQIKTSHLRVNSGYLGIFKNINNKFGKTKDVEIEENILSYSEIIGILSELEDGYVIQYTEMLNGFGEIRVKKDGGNVIIEYEEIAFTYDDETFEKNGERRDLLLQIFLPKGSNKPANIRGYFEYYEDSFVGEFTVSIKKDSDNVLNFSSSSHTESLQFVRQLAKSDLNYIMSMTNYWFKDNHNFDLEKIGMF